MPEEFNLYGPDPPDVDPDEFESWILFEDDYLLVFDKTVWLVCHPSKTGPLSSLIGAARSYIETDRLHLVARLDRETSGFDFNVESEVFTAPVAEDIRKLCRDTMGNASSGFISGAAISKTISSQINRRSRSFAHE